MNLTKRQHELLVFIRDYATERGICPSFEEMMDALGLSSKSGVHRLVEGLIARGHLRRIPGYARSLELLGGWAVKPDVPPAKAVETSEDRLHKSVADYLRAMHPNLLWFHPANGGSRSAREGAKLKAMGVLAGTPDLAFILPGGQAAFIELKAKSGTLSPSQKAFMDRAAAAKAWVAVCRSVDEVVAVLDEWGVKSRYYRRAA